MIETDDGYAVWDDIRDEIYVDSEGVRETCLLYTSCVMNILHCRRKLGWAVKLRSG